MSGTKAADTQVIDSQYAIEYRSLSVSARFRALTNISALVLSVMNLGSC